MQAHNSKVKTEECRFLVTENLEAIPSALSVPKACERSTDYRLTLLLPFMREIAVGYVGGCFNERGDGSLTLEKDEALREERRGRETMLKD